MGSGGGGGAVQLSHFLMSIFSLDAICLIECCINVAMNDLISSLLTANSIWESLLKHE